MATETRILLDVFLICGTICAVMAIVTMFFYWTLGPSGYRH